MCTRAKYETEFPYMIFFFFTTVLPGPQETSYKIIHLLPLNLRLS